MTVCDSGCTRPFRSEIERWQALGGGTHSDGTIVTKPHALANADLIINLCERFHCLPSQLLKEDAEFLRLLAIHDLGDPERGE